MPFPVGCREQDVVAVAAADVVILAQRLRVQIGALRHLLLDLCALPGRVAAKHRRRGQGQAHHQQAIHSVVFRLDPVHQTRRALGVCFETVNIFKIRLAFHLVGQGAAVQQTHVFVGWPAAPAQQGAQAAPRAAGLLHYYRDLGAKRLGSDDKLLRHIRAQYHAADRQNTAALRRAMSRSRPVSMLRGKSSSGGRRV